MGHLAAGGVPGRAGYKKSAKSKGRAMAPHPTAIVDYMMADTLIQNGMLRTRIGTCCRWATLSARTRGRRRIAEPSAYALLPAPLGARLGIGALLLAAGG
jgi:hypothetical protein